MNSVDTVAAHRAHLSPHLAAPPLSSDPLGSDARLLHLVAAGSPRYPYIWGLFGCATDGRGEREPALTPVPLHTPHLTRISADLHLRHSWGL